MVISVEGREGNKKSRIRRGFETLNHVVRAHWPIVKKLPILYPFGWVFFIIRLFVLIIMGKRPSLHLGDLIDGSKQRSELYASLKLFERDKQK